jgi:hypothetical protein
MLFLYCRCCLFTVIILSLASSLHDSFLLPSLTIFFVYICVFSVYIWFSTLFFLLLNKYWIDILYLLLPPCQICPKSNFSNFDQVLEKYVHMYKFK